MASYDDSCTWEEYQIEPEDSISVSDGTILHENISHEEEAAGNWEIDLIEEVRKYPSTLEHGTASCMHPFGFFP